MNPGNRPQLKSVAKLAMLPIVAVFALVLASCSSTDTTASSASPVAAPLTSSDTWAKATDGPMSAAFGMIKNNSDETVTITSATTSASDKTELHETTEIDGQSQMQVKEGGFEIPAGDTLKLEPGGNHIMIMNLQEPIKSGDDVTVELMLANGDTMSFTAQAKETNAGEEPYHESQGGSSDSGSSSSSASPSSSSSGNGSASPSSSMTHNNTGSASPKASSSPKASPSK